MKYEKIQLYLQRLKSRKIRKQINQHYKYISILLENFKTCYPKLINNPKLIGRNIKKKSDK